MLIAVIDVYIENHVIHYERKLWNTFAIILSSVFIFIRLGADHSMTKQDHTFYYMYFLRKLYSFWDSTESGSAWYISPIYIIDHWYISDIFIRKYRIFSIYTIFVEFLKYFNVTHCDYVLMSAVCVFCWLMTCALSIFSVLDNFCQIAPLHNNAVWMTRVLHLICKAHTYYCWVVNFIF